MSKRTFKWWQLPLIFSTAFLLNACTLSQNSTPLNSSFSVDNDEILLALPDFDEREDHQIMIARLTQLLAEQSTTHEQRAQILYQLGLLYDRLGMEVTARTMFMNALIEVPDFAEAYNFLGIYLSTTERFAEAYDAWDAVLEINPKDEYALFNRGIALYYGNRPSLGLSDLLAFYERQPDDPFRSAWLYILEHEVYGEQYAQEKLADRRQRIPSTVAWGTEVLDMMLGKLSEADLIKLLRDSDFARRGELAHRLCESYFYMAKMALFKGQKKRAYDLFHLCVVTGITGYLEYRYSVLEIDRLERQATEQQILGAEFTPEGEE